jgi:hypothetical protein
MMYYLCVQRLVVVLAMIHVNAQKQMSIKDSNKWKGPIANEEHISSLPQKSLHHKLIYGSARMWLRHEFYDIVRRIPYQREIRRTLQATDVEIYP